MSSRQRLLVVAAAVAVAVIAFIAVRPGDDDDKTTATTTPTTADLYDAHVLKNYNRSALTVVRGSGSHVWDETGRRYLDFTSGIAVSALGHCHPDWVAAVQRQAGELIHVSNLFRNPQ